MKTRRRITSHEVAKRAGVSRTTVSLVLNDVKGIRISEETRQRVLSAARELGYTPNASARSLVSGRTRTIGLVICQPAEHILIDAYLPQVLYGLSEVSRKRGFRVLVEAVEDVSQPDAYIHLARGKQIDGMAILGPRLDDQSLPSLIDDGFPLVLIGRLEDLPTPAVAIDEATAASHAVAHLLSLGHQRVACITNGPPHYSSAMERLRGYQRAIERANRPFDEQLIHYGNFDPKSGYDAMQQLLREGSPPTAIFVASDVVAFGVIAAAAEAGLRIPDDLAIVGFDDVPLARYIHPALTTVHLPAIEQGWRAGEILIGLISGEEPAEQSIAMETRLVIRASCGANQHAPAHPGTLNPNLERG